MGGSLQVLGVFKSTGTLKLNGQAHIRVGQFARMPVHTRSRPERWLQSEGSVPSSVGQLSKARQAWDHVKIGSLLREIIHFAFPADVLPLLRRLRDSNEVLAWLVTDL